MRRLFLVANSFVFASRGLDLYRTIAMSVNSTPNNVHNNVPDLFPHRIPESRLGKSHDSMDAFTEATNYFTPEYTKEYSLVMVTEPLTRRILLGEKHRGFGTGMNNSFGGKVEPGETDLQSAVRELQEETGIVAPASSFLKTGELHFTFDDTDMKMLVHLFRLDVSCSKSSDDARSDSGGDNPKYFRLDPNVIRGCEEITPFWLEDWFQIPLHNMFADDSLWLTQILASQDLPLFVEGHFHFEPGGQEVNTIRHYFMSFRAAGKSLEKRLFHELHRNKISSPSIKEFKEAYAFANAAKSFFGKNAFDVVLDVAGGHGALAALLMLTTSANQAVVIDPANIGGGSVELAWGKYLKQKTLQYRYECLRTGLPTELDRFLKQGIARERILVVACHACQHLSDETLQIACSDDYQVAAAIMPCCQKDSLGTWKSASKNLGLPIAIVMDLILAGKAMTWNLMYDVRMKMIDPAITPQNRIILCRPLSSSSSSHGYDKSSVAVATASKIDKAHESLERAYRKAHRISRPRRRFIFNWTVDVTSLSIGMAVGAVICFAATNGR